MQFGDPMTRPSERIREEATRGLQILQEGIHSTNAYDRTTFSDLRTFYNNLYQVAKQAAKFEELLVKIGVDFEDHSDDEEPYTIEDFENDLRNISGVSPISTGQVGGGLETASNSSPHSEPSGTPRISLVVKPLRLNGIQSKESIRPLSPPPIPDWFRYQNEHGE